MLHPAAARGPDPRERLAAELRGLYAPPRGPEERWRRRPVRLPDGRDVDRSLAYRDDPGFVAAAARLVASRAEDDAPLGAWLIGGVLETRRAEAEPALARALANPDERVAFEAAQALGASGSAASLDPLQDAAHASASADVRAAARWAAAEVARRAGSVPEARDEPGATPLAPGFRRGVSWWMSESRQDHGAASFRRLASLGVTWVSLHTWDPLQRGLDEPVFADPERRHGFRDLRALVASAHAAGLRVMVKPHLEMTRLRAHAAQPHRDAEQPGLARWFESYRGYLLPFAREAQQAGADMFCVGRELDSSVVAREADWRDVVARVRAEFHGPLTYSANFDSWQAIGFWDALDFIGVSAYFPLSDRADPPLAELEAGWQRALAPLAAAARRWRQARAADRGRLPLDPERRADAVARGARGGRRLAAGALLRGDAACARAPAGGRGCLLLAVGADLGPAVPRRLARDRRQAGELRDGAALSGG